MDELYLEKDALDLVPHHMAKYSTEIILDRAIPDLRDGLKPVQRRILYTMQKAKLGASAKHMKQAKAAGMVLSYHPHGDSSIIDAMTLLSQSWKQRLPLVDMEGNNGSIDGDPAAAARYVSVRLTKAAELMLSRLKEETVDFMPSFDGEDEEPVVLPVRWPVLFTNGAEGVAVGYSCSFVPHNPIELLEGAILLNQDPDASLDAVMEYVKGPDFPTGGLVMGREGVLDLYKTGKGSFQLRGKAEIQGQSIVITEIPYRVAKKKLVMSLYEAIEKAGATHQIKDIYDDSQGLGVHIVIDLKRGYDPQLILDLLYQSSLLQVSVSGNHVAIHEQKPQFIGLIPYLKAFLAFRQETLRRAFRYEWEQRKARLHLVEGFLKLTDCALEVVSMIQSSNGRSEVLERLEAFGFSAIQSKAIADMPLHRISKQDALALKKEAKALNERLGYLGKVARDADLFKQVLEEDLKETIQLLGPIPRQTALMEDVEKVEVVMTDLMKSEKTYVVVKPRTIQRMSVRMYEDNIDKYDGDLVSAELGETTDYALFFTQSGRCLQRVVGEIDYQSLANDLEDLQHTVSDFKSKDQLVGQVLFDALETDLEVVSLTAQGMLKRCPLSKLFLSFNTKGYLSKTKVYNGLKLKGDRVIDLQVGSPEALDKLVYHLTRSSGRGRSVTVSLKDWSLQGAGGSGSRAYSMKADEEVVIEKVEVRDDEEERTIEATPTSLFEESTDCSNSTV